MRKNLVEEIKAIKQKLSQIAYAGTSDYSEVNRLIAQARLDNRENWENEKQDIEAQLHQLEQGMVEHSGRVREGKALDEVRRRVSVMASPVYRAGKERQSQIQSRRQNHATNISLSGGKVLHTVLKIPRITDINELKVIGQQIYENLEPARSSSIVDYLQEMSNSNGLPNSVIFGEREIPLPLNGSWQFFQDFAKTIADSYGKKGINAVVAGIEQAGNDEKARVEMLNFQQGGNTQ